jgi:hypothetical protein
LEVRRLLAVLEIREDDAPLSSPASGPGIRPQFAEQLVDYGGRGIRIDFRYFFRLGGAEKNAQGPSGVASRPKVRLGDDVEPVKRQRVAVNNASVTASAYQRRVVFM